MIRIKIVLILGRGGLLLLLVLVQVVLLGELQVPQELRITTWMRRDFRSILLANLKEEETAWRGAQRRGYKLKIFGPTLHAHVPPGGGLLDSTTMVLPGLKNKLLGNTMAQNYDRNNSKSQGT